MTQELKYEVPIKHFQGKTRKFFTLGRFRTVVAVILFLGFSCSVCDEVVMVSVPLGFEISGFDRSRTWVSQNGVFAFGFLESDKKDDSFDGFVVGVRYNLGNTAANVPVWTVGGGLRVSMNSTIRLSVDGRLILLENSVGLIVWSSNTSNLGVQSATLSNSGNLILMGAGNNVLWQSFNSPTSTLLPGQSLHFPQTLRAPSTKSISSYYNFVIRRSGELALVWEHNVTYWSGHLSSSVGIKEARFDANGRLEVVDVSNKIVRSLSSKDFEDSSVSLRHLRMDSDGNLRIYSWDHVLNEWKVGWQAVENQCDVFGSCGLYSLCEFKSTGPVCDCLHKDLEDEETGLAATDGGSLGCKKMVDLGNCKTKSSMMILKETILYGLYPPQDVNMMLNEEKCKEYCSNDNSCIAATSKNDGSGICTIKRTWFIAGYRKPSVTATSFLKVCLVPQAVAAQRADHRVGSNPIPLPSKATVNGRVDYKEFVGDIALIVLVTVSGFLTIEVLVLWFIYHRGQVKARSRIPFRKDAQMNAHYSFLFRLSFEEIKEVTSNYADQLGPSVYKGVLPSKTAIVVKELNDVIANEKDFRVAVSTLGGLQHRNLVVVKGFCFEADHRFLLYEFVQNGSLDKWLFNMEHDQVERSWQQKLDISLGIARALAYLHSECQICIAHGNLKLENVLLDENLVPKLTDYGLTSFLQKKAASSSDTSPQRDIYMLGEMLLQIMTCKRDVLDSHDMQCIINDIVEKVNLEDSVKSEGVERVMRIALWCMHHQPGLRPSIDEVVKVIEGTLSVDRPPSVFLSGKDQIDESLNY